MIFLIFESLSSANTSSSYLLCIFIQNSAELPKNFENRNAVSAVIFRLPLRIAAILGGSTNILFANAYGTSQGEERYNPSCDLNHDGNINNLDLAILASNSGGTVCEED